LFYFFVLFFLFIKIFPNCSRCYISIFHGLVCILFSFHNFFCLVSLIWFFSSNSIFILIEFFRVIKSVLWMEFFLWIEFFLLIGFFSNNRLSSNDRLFSYFLQNLKKRKFNRSNNIIVCCLDPQWPPGPLRSNHYSKELIRIFIINRNFLIDRTLIYQAWY